MEDFCGLLRSVCEDEDAGRQYLLRQFFVREKRLCSMSESMVWDVLRASGWRPLLHVEALDEDGEELEVADKTRFEAGMNGAHLTSPFQCELCHFRNIYGRNPRADRHQDVYTMITMRWANFDAMWAREPSNVGSSLREWKRLKKT